MILLVGFPCANALCQKIIKKVPFKVKLFKLVAINGDIAWVITNDLDETVITQVAQHCERVALSASKNFTAN